MKLSDTTFYSFALETVQLGACLRAGASNLPPKPMHFAFYPLFPQNVLISPYCLQIYEFSPISVKLAFLLNLRFLLPLILTMMHVLLHHALHLLDAPVTGCGVLVQAPLQ